MVRLVFVFRIVNRARRVRGARALVDANGSTRAAGLEHADQLQPDHLEHGQERENHVPTRGHIVEQVLEAAGVGLRQPSEQLVDAQFDRHLFGRQHDRRPLARAFEHLLEGRQQREQVDFELRLVVVAGNLFDARIGAAPLRVAQRLRVEQQLGGHLELLMLEQAPHQQVARILFLLRRVAGGGLWPR